MQKYKTSLTVAYVALACIYVHCAFSLEQCAAIVKKAPSTIHEAFTNVFQAARELSKARCAESWNDRIKHSSPMLPGCTGSVDGVPLPIRGDREDFTGKSKSKVLNFQVHTKTCGRLGCWSGPTPGAETDSDSVIHLAEGKKEHFRNEYLLGDPAYAALAHFITSCKEGEIDRKKRDKDFWNAFDQKLRRLRNRGRRN